MNPLRSRQSALRGLSLVELMIGLAVSLWLLLGALQLASQQIAAFHHHTRELRLNQQLRTAMDIMTRDLRRAGHWTQALEGLPSPNNGTAAANPQSMVNLDTESSATRIEYTYDRDTTITPLAFGFQRQAIGQGSGVLQIKNAAGGWQPLTPPATVNITQLRFVSVLHTEPLWRHCPCRFQAVLSPACSDTALAALAAAPRLQLRAFNITLTGSAPSDATLSRSVRQTVHLPNVVLEGADLCPPS